MAPDTINNHVKTCHEEQKNLHFYAPEYGGTQRQMFVFIVTLYSFKLYCFLITLFFMCLNVVGWKYFIYLLNEFHSNPF